MGIFKAISALLQYKDIPPVSPESDSVGVQLDSKIGTDFIINKDDPRFIKCHEEAIKLRDKVDAETGKTYKELLETLDPKKPDELKKIVGIEKDISTTLNKVVHEQFGKYNGAASSALDLFTEPEDLHNEGARFNSHNPLQLKELKNGELNCRHFAPLANILSAEAGMKVKRITALGYSGPEVLGMPPLEHTTVISELTGNIVEFTKKGSGYLEPEVKSTVEQFQGGKDILVKNEEGGFNILHRVSPTIGEQIEEHFKIKDKLQKFMNYAGHGNMDDAEKMLGIPQIPDHVKQKALDAIGENGIAKPSGEEFKPFYPGPSAPQNTKVIAH